MGEVKVPAEFRERVKRELSAEEVASLKLYSITSPLGHKLLFLPVVKAWGREVFYSPRLHLKGVSGPIRLNKEAAIGAGFDPSIVEKARIFCEELNRYYSPLLKTVEGLTQAKELAKVVEGEVKAETESEATS